MKQELYKQLRAIIRNRGLSMEAMIHTINELYEKEYLKLYEKRRDDLIGFTELIEINDCYLTTEEERINVVDRYLNNEL